MIYLSDFQCQPANNNRLSWESINNIKKMYSVSRDSLQGDPCIPNGPRGWIADVVPAIILGPCHLECPLMEIFMRSKVDV